MTAPTPEPLTEPQEDALREALLLSVDFQGPAAHQRLGHVATVVARLIADATADLRAELAGERAKVAGERAGRRIAGEAADRFRDVVSEALGLDENPGDDALVEGLRAHFGKTGPEPRRWRDFINGHLARLSRADAARLRGDA